ncbi:MAG: glycosyltransferase family 39 protein [Deltaproteobacteria bacterium]|nr:glycosyltransferase family 39 protein [Deltaproteobacteria bacterium]
MTTTIKDITKRLRLRGLLLFIAGITPLFLMMANDKQLPHGTLYGFIALLFAILGVLDLLGLFYQPPPLVVSIRDTALCRLEGELRWTAPVLTFPIALVVGLLLLVVLGPIHLPWIIGAALCIIGLSAIRRPALLVLVVVSFIYLPMLGAYGLWDPWETHYGEVSREILSRDDWISLWWAQDGWFWSKPIFIFWSEALTWHATGIPYRPDTNFDYSEWILRFPIYLLSMGALLSIYLVVSKAFSKRAAVLSALTVGTIPYFFFLAHQAITDMPFVANMTIAVSLLLLAVFEDPERTATGYRVGRLVLSAQHLVIAVLLALVLPQIIYLTTRNVTLIDGPLFAWHKDQFISGSADNNGIPGNSPLHGSQPYLDALWFQPICQAALWLCGLLALLFALRRERRVQALTMFGFYIFCALAFMSKGIPGVALPGLIALLYLLTSQRWSLLLEGKLRIAAGIVTVTIVGMPWFVAMFFRHGQGFTNRLLIHDHINRLAAGVHGDTGSIQYFMAQFGYGMFPWIALVPAALLVWPFWRTAGDPDSKTLTMRRDTIIVMSVWFAATFTLFSAMITKFHHYIFPAAPPMAVLIGLIVDRMLQDRLTDRSPLETARILLPIMVAPVFWVVSIAGFVGDVRGVIPKEVKSAEAAYWAFDHPWHPAVCIILFIIGIALALYSARAIGRQAGAKTPAAQSVRGREISLGVALVAGAIVSAFVGRDLSWTTSSKPAGYERLIHLFVYNYDRPWPEQFDYRPILLGFTVVASVCVVAAALRALRPLMTCAVLGTALAFSFWCLNFYMIDLSPHWGQQTLMKKYYETRKGPEEPLVAWQMNWKGENFYTGNRVSVFVSLKNEDLTQWISKNRGKRAFFVLEHTRLGRFRGLLAGKKLTEVTSMRDCNKFILLSARL